MNSLLRFILAAVLAAMLTKALVASAHAELYRDRYWPKPTTNEAAVARMLGASTYDPDPKIAAGQMRRDAQIEAERIKAATEAAKLRQQLIIKNRDDTRRTAPTLPATQRARRR